MYLTIGASNTDPKLESSKLIEKGEDYIIFKSGFGCTLKDDYLPEHFYRKPIPEGTNKGCISGKDMHPISTLLVEYTLTFHIKTNIRVE
jgi:hypothetical protein